MRKSKLTLKKITVSNLSADYAKLILGGGDPNLVTYGPAGDDPTTCTQSCTENNCVCSPDLTTVCASAMNGPVCTVQTGCTGNLTP